LFSPLAAHLICSEFRSDFRALFADWADLNVSLRIICRGDHGWREFNHPVAVLVARSLPEVQGVLTEVESATTRGLIAAGFVAYEAAPAFDSSLTARSGGEWPLVCFGLYAGWSSHPGPQPTTAAHTSLATPSWSLNTSTEAYGAKLRSIREALAEGRSYQINHTERLSAKGIDAWTLFSMVAGEAPYAAYIEAPDFAVVSASPELFFELLGDVIVCKPMKGTTARSAIPEADEDRAKWLRSSTKNRAENVMITDMVRHELGRIARIGSVRVTELFGVERFAHVWQMTSTVQANTDASLSGILRALFPGASVTGAPKTASMQLIADLEDSPRGIYTGAIGVVEPGRKARFSIAIRTAWFDHHSDTAVYGAGGGIVWDSRAEDEWDELLAKAQVVNRPARPAFELFETLRFTPTNGYFLRHLHRDRLAASAHWFGWRFDVGAFDRLLDQAARSLRSAARIRVRLRPNGQLSLQSSPFSDSGAAVSSIELVKLPAGLDPVFLHHKTSNRRHYDPDGSSRERLFFNPEGQVTESSIASVVYELEGAKYTPPVTDGLLGGVWRRQLLEQGAVRERSLAIAELANLSRLWLVNALRGERQVLEVLDDRQNVLFVPRVQTN